MISSIRTTIQVKTHAQMVVKKIEAGEDVFRILNEADSNVIDCSDDNNGSSLNNRRTEEINSFPIIFKCEVKVMNENQTSSMTKAVPKNNHRPRSVTLDERDRTLTPQKKVRSSTIYYLLE